MKIKIPLIKPILTDEMVNAAIKALKSELFLRGESVKRFEEEFRGYIGVKHAVAVNSGTSALHLSLIAMDVKSGDYVITTPATFIVTANAIVSIWDLINLHEEKEAEFTIVAVKNYRLPVGLIEVEND